MKRPVLCLSLLEMTAYNEQMFTVLLFKNKGSLIQGPEEKVYFS